MAKLMFQKMHVLLQKIFTYITGSQTSLATKKHDKKKLVETPLLQNCKAMKPFRDRTNTSSIFCYGQEKKES